MAFQDFDLLKERQRIDNERKLKRNVTIGIVVSVVVVAAVVAIVCIDLNTRNDPEKPAKKTKPRDDKDYSFSKSLKTTVKTVCASTDYKATCESSLGNVIHTNPSQKHQPKDLLKASFSVVSNELDKAMKQSSKFKLDTPEKKEAFEVCKKVISDAKQELNSSADTVGKNDIGTLTWKKHDLNNWLSAVMSYQQTCIDSFPEGDAKTEMKKALQNSKELTSNSLAIVSQFSSIISSIQKPKRHLLSVSKNRSSHAENFTTWMSIEEKRMLKVDPPKQKPDVTVAKDGSGDFQTINDALAKLPQNHHGRCT